jgi:hypothetical protein
MLGYTLNPNLVDENLYTETGKTDADWCPCSNVDVDNLSDPDAVVYAYRLFPYNRHDKYLALDPFSAIHAVKLIKDGVTFRTFDTDDFRVDYGRGGWAKFIEMCTSCLCRRADCVGCVQLAVDADWLWDGTTGNELPTDLQDVWVDMVTYYADPNFGVKSQTLGTHSYSLFDNTPPQDKPQNKAIISRYAGPHGSAVPTVTV